MIEHNLNILSFDIPYPPDYGGVIDVFYKIKALHEQGVNIYLHCFEYGRTEEKELEKYCKKVFYYKRKTGKLNNLSLLPYITYSRRSKELSDHLNANTYPILLEGLHSVYYLLKGKFENRILLLRSHNIEHDYYEYLANREKNIIKKLYFYKEAFLLKTILKKIPPDTQIGAISLPDKDYLKKRFKNTFWLPPFHSNEKFENIEGNGEYALYHGNLSVNENIEVAEFLIDLFTGKEVNLIIAGKNPTYKILDLTKSVGNIKVISNPGYEKMNTLIKNAHVVLLPTFQPTGIKLKLIESLCKGRFCVANHSMIDNTRLENCVVMAEKDFYEKTLELMELTFTKAEINQRKEVMNTYYNNANNAKLIIEKIAEKNNP